VTARLQLGKLSGRSGPAQPSPKVCAQPDRCVPSRRFARLIAQVLPAGVPYDATAATIIALMTPRRGPTSTTAIVRTTHSGLSRG